MRIALSLVMAMIGAVPALADDLLLSADIAAATIYLSGAEVSRCADLAIAPGSHQIVMAMQDAAQAERIALSAPEGVIIGQPRKITAYPIAEGVLDDPAQASARAVRDTAEMALTQAQDNLALVDREIPALEAQLRFVNTLAGAGMAEMDPDRLPQLLTTLGAETARLERALHAARIARRDLDAVVQTRAVALAAAQTRWTG